MRAVDPNVLVRILIRDEARQAAAADVFVEVGACVSILALAEATWVLRTVYERSAKDLATAVEMLLNHKDLTLQDSDAVLLALELFRSRPRLGFSDRLILELPRRRDIRRLAHLTRPGKGSGGAEAVGTLVKIPRAA